MCRITGLLSAYDNKLELSARKQETADDATKPHVRGTLMGTLSSDALSAALTQEGMKFENVKSHSGDTVTFKIVSLFWGLQSSSLLFSQRWKRKLHFSEVVRKRRSHAVPLRIE